MIHPRTFKSTTEIAQSMLSRYSSPRVAADMAELHSQDYLPGSEDYNWWQAVRCELLRLTKEKDR